MRLHDLRAPKGANKARKRIARGESSGHGKTAGRGGKGQTARTGKGKPRPGFEGGQVPMYRRMPKRGFRSKIDRQMEVAVNVDVLAAKFANGATVDLQALRQCGLANKNSKVLRILGRGEIGIALTVHAAHVSASAREKILSAGGSVAS